MQTTHAILELLAGALPGVDPSDVARAYAAIQPHLKAPKRARTATTAAAADTATMNDAALFAHYKKTAPYADLQFFVAHCANDEIRAAAGDLSRAAFDEAGGLLIARPEFYRRLRSLQDRWRRDTNEIQQRQREAEREAERRAICRRVLEAVAASEYARTCSRFAMVA